MCTRALRVWWQGGALDAAGGVIQLQRTRFTANAAQFGGAVHATGGAQLDISSSSFTANTAVAYGGAIDAHACSYVTISE